MIAGPRRNSLDLFNDDNGNVIETSQLIDETSPCYQQHTGIMNHIGDVVCAIIEDGDQFLIAQRPPNHPLAEKWEFPGGKVRQDESPSSAVKREILEELNTVIEVISPLTPNDHCYDHLSLTLIPFRCSIIEGYPSPQEHSRIAWVNAETATKYDFAAADIPILEEYLQIRRSR